MKDDLIAHTLPGGRPDTTPQRTTHGSCAWSLPSRHQTLRQPQDGAVPVGALRSMEGRAISNPLVEADDARLSGNLRSLARRVRGLNVTQARPTDSLLRAETLPVSYFAETKTTTRTTPLPAATRSGSVFARPRGVKNAAALVSQTQVA